MLFLLFQLGDDRYAIDVEQVAEVLPLLDLKAFPLAPRGVAGAFDYHGSPVPVIDLSEVMLGRPARRWLSTRLILVQYAGGRRLLGVIAERATETLRCERAEFVDSGVASDGAPSLGPVRADARGLVQWIEVDSLLPEAVRQVLFQEALPA